MITMTNTRAMEITRMMTMHDVREDNSYYQDGDDDEDDYYDDDDDE